MSKLVESEFFGDQEARWYQMACKGAVEVHLANGVKRICIVQPTGSGKTLSFGLVLVSSRVRDILNIRKRKLRLLFITHKHRLRTQAERAFAHLSNVEFIPHSAFAQLPDAATWDIACIDEAHHEAMMSIQLQLDRLADKPIIGLTATPERADGCVIKFEEIVEPISREQAVKEGWLADTTIHSIVDGGEKDKTGILKKVFAQYGKEMGKSIVFVRTKKEAREITQYLIETGFSAMVITNQTDDDVDCLLDGFSAGAFQFIVNCNKVSEGVDVVGCRSIVIGKQLNSYVQLNQIIGRASRPDSECHVYELINPLSGRNLDTTAVTGTPKKHRLLNLRRGVWVENEFDYVRHDNKFAKQHWSQ